eukprot:CAMPEP_0198150696 /NCGR_PEP_ID=MMETSP1443-20131203/52001_1 /TAXON_ID=186043 /ORGANISM="Entomoneis sp., Strain CCMP2396" /LENGTH=488 /DNA_ID=CAMNT_0043816083 /DNA_START=35 /DNA_END=1498 /DNA_ORIENTATION=+
MALVHRKIIKPTLLKQRLQRETKGKRSECTSYHAWGLLFLSMSAVIAIAAWFIPSARNAQFSLGGGLEHLNNSEFHIVSTELAQGFTLVSYLKKLGGEHDHNEDPGKIALGTHRMQVSFNNLLCNDPKFSIRLVGTSLVHVHLIENPDSRTWSGEFTLPVAGSYTINSQWYGCEVSTIGAAKQQVATTQSYEAVGSTLESSKPLSNSIFPTAYWQAPPGNLTAAASLSEYLWVDPARDERTILTTSDSSVVKESVATKENGFYQFHQHSNYELLCFIGNQTMAEIRREFLELIPKIGREQRPFKFRMYNMAGDFQRPDKYWDLEDKKRLGKCKHMLINLEELETNLSQQEYQDQLTTFVGHLLKVMDDDTFPIRLLTWMQSPGKATACHHPFQPRTTDHPCNDALRRLFDPENPAFPPRVKLLDNTDITLPLFDEGAVTQSIANVALRLFAIAGQQVAEWRDSRQSGHVDGLHKNCPGKSCVIEPNIE